MGQIKTLYIKNLAKTLLEKYPDRFSKSFEKNKEELNKLVEMESKVIRNMIAGYLVHLIGKMQRPPGFEPANQVKEIEQKKKRK